MDWFLFASILRVNSGFWYFGGVKNILVVAAFVSKNDKNKVTARYMDTKEFKFWRIFAHHRSST